MADPSEKPGNKTTGSVVSTAGIGGVILHGDDSCVQLLDARRGRHATGPAPGDELNRVDPPLPGLHLPDERVGLVQPLTKRPLGERGRRSPLSQQLAHVAVRRGVLCSCTHLGRKLG